MSSASSKIVTLFPPDYSFSFPELMFIEYVQPIFENDVKNNSEFSYIGASEDLQISFNNWLRKECKIPSHNSTSTSRAFHVALLIRSIWEKVRLQLHDKLSHQGKRDEIREERLCRVTANKKWIQLTQELQAKNYSTKFFTFQDILFYSNIGRFFTFREAQFLSNLGSSSCFSAKV